MLERHEAHDDPNRTGRDAARDAARPGDRLAADREVPLPGADAADTGVSVVQQWLDGEASEADARLADAPAVTFWTRFDADMASHRQAKAPAHLAAAIMAAIARAESGGSLTATPRADLAPPRDG